MASGRGVISKKDLTDEARAFDIVSLNKQKVVSKGSGWQWESRWTRLGEVVAKVTYNLETIDNEPHAIRLSYSITDWQGQKTDYNYSVQLTSTPCHLGGRRWWFICPLVRNYIPCGRRCRIIYLPYHGRYFGCRECYDLTYESRQRHRDSFYESFKTLRKIMRNESS